MKKLQSVLLKISFLICFLLLSVPNSATASNYDQPAFISNIYFTYKVAQTGKNLQPDLIVNAIKANDPRAAVQLVIDLVGDKGTHSLELEILDMKEIPLPGTLKFPPYTSAGDNMYFKLSTTLRGKFPEGGVFFKIYDTLDTGKKTLIGTYRMMTVK